MTDRPAEFTVRRALWVTATNLFFALGLFALTLANLYWQWSRGESLVTGAIFAFVAAFYALQTFGQLRDRRPQLIIGAAGLGLPTATADPIPWPRIHRLRVKRRLIPTLGGQIDLDVDLETFARLKFGQRFLGDFVVKRRGLGSSFTVLTQGMDRGTADIELAIKRYWPPDSV